MFKYESTKEELERCIIQLEDLIIKLRHAANTGETSHLPQKGIVLLYAAKPSEEEFRTESLIDCEEDLLVYLLFQLHKVFPATFKKTMAVMNVERLLDDVIQALTPKQKDKKEDIPTPTHGGSDAIN